MSALVPVPRWRSAHPDPHKGADLEGRFTSVVFETPIDCQAIFHRSQFVASDEVSAGGLFLMPLSTRPDKSSAQTVRAIFPVRCCAPLPRAPCQISGKQSPALSNASHPMNVKIISPLPDTTQPDRKML
jgi:hypothetical protein